MSKKTYIVFVKEIHQTQIQVEADDKFEALGRAMNGDGIWVDNTTEFIETLDMDHWDVIEAD